MGSHTFTRSRGAVMRLRLPLLALALSLLLSWFSPDAARALERMERYAPQSWVRAHFEALFSLSSLSIVLWYAGSWFFCTKARRQRLAYPLFHVPYGLEPAYAGYIKQLRFDADLFLADLVDLAVRGFVSISPLDAALSVSRTRKRWSDLSAAHRAMMESLFAGGRPSVVICGGDGAGSMADVAFTKAQVSLMPSFYGVKRRLAARKDAATCKLPRLVKWNYKPVFCGLPLFVPFFLLMRSGGWISSGGVIPVGLAALFFAPFFTSAVSTIKNLRKNQERRAIASGLHWNRRDMDARHVKKRRGVSPASVFASAALLALFSLAIPFLIISRLLAMFFAGSLQADPQIVTLAGAAIASALVFSAIIPERTHEGKKLLARVEGFETFLKTAERNRMETLYPFRGQKIPELTSDLYERFLPYAIAFGAAEIWSESFEGLLAESGYSPSWYGGAFDARVFCAETMQLGASISAARRNGPRDAGPVQEAPQARRRGRKGR
ncbi:MAG: DUF2207 domain-containing protein [Synergistaceae bacterium]|nr:DUF2207 domain-containing protein [Synergistaceae bacterium]